MQGWGIKGDHWAPLERHTLQALHWFINRKVQHIISAHIQALLDLPKLSNKLASFKFFYDSVESHIGCLQFLGKLPESFDTLLAPIILTKLSDKTKHNIARNHMSGQY